MNKFLVALLAFLLISLYYPTTTHKEVSLIRIAIIDTGVDLTDANVKEHLCSDLAPKDFTVSGVQDTIGHGTAVAHLIIKNAREANYCLAIYKFYKVTDTTEVTLSMSNEAFKAAIKDNVTLINYSAGGSTYSEEEKNVIGSFKGPVVVAAGNDGQSLDGKSYRYYPASYGLKNIVVVGSLDRQYKKSSFSNYGSVVRLWDVGEYDNDTNGTSFSAAAISGKITYSIHRLGNSGTIDIDKLFR